MRVPVQNKCPHVVSQQDYVSHRGTIHQDKVLHVFCSAVSLASPSGVQFANAQPSGCTMTKCLGVGMQPAAFNQPEEHS